MFPLPSIRNGQPPKISLEFISDIHNLNTLKPNYHENFRNFILIVLLIGVVSKLDAQYDSVFHEAKFEKFNGLMHSNRYKVDNWGKKLYDSSEKAIFPDDIKKNPDNFKGKLIQWIGIVQNLLSYK